MKPSKTTTNKTSPFFRYLIILFGAAMTAFAVSVFYVPNKIVSGGISGIAVLLRHSLNVPVGFSVALMNGVLLLLAWVFLGKRFVRETVVGTILFSFFVHVFSHIPPVTDDLVLATVFGAALYGVGIGLVLTQEASTGGTDIIGRLLQKFFPHLPIGTVLLAVDSSIVLSSLLLFGKVHLVLYGIIALYIASFAVNWLIRRLNVSKLAFVITGHGLELSKELVSNSPRGVTIISATGGYTMSDKQVLLCALKEKELEQFQKRISTIDQDSFVIFSESQQIVGNGFRIYR